MRTVKWLREELAKYPEDAVSFAYEGEITGIVICKDGKQGAIHCSEWDDTGKESCFLTEKDRNK